MRASCCAAAGLRDLTTSSTSRSISERSWTSTCRDGPPSGGGTSRSRLSKGQRSAGWTRSAPAICCTSRYCANSATGWMGLPPSTPSRYSMRAKPAFSTVVAVSSVQVSGLRAKRLTAASIARNTCAGAVMPTISSAPTAWCSCWRARRSGAGSRASRSSRRDCSDSRTKRRIDLLAPSSDLRSSSNTQARGPRSAIGVSGCGLPAVVSSMLKRWWATGGER